MYIPRPHVVQYFQTFGRAAAQASHQHVHLQNDLGIPGGERQGELELTVGLRGIVALVVVAEGQIAVHGWK